VLEEDIFILTCVVAGNLKIMERSKVARILFEENKNITIITARTRVV
jgi:hypothetical protein